MIYVANRETGDKIEAVRDRAEGMERIRAFEEQDKAEGIYEPNFYDVIDGDGTSLI